MRKVKGKALKKSLSFFLLIFMIVNVFSFQLSGRKVQALEDEKTVESIGFIQNTGNTTFIKEEDGWWINEDNISSKYFYYPVENIAYSLGLQINYSDGSNEKHYYNGEGNFFINGEQVHVITDQDVNPWAVGTHKVTVKYMDRTLDFNVDIVENPVEGIEIIKAPDKVKFIENNEGYLTNKYNSEEEFFYYFSNDLTGLQLKIKYTDGRIEIATIEEFVEHYSINGQRLYMHDNQYESPWGVGEHEITLRYMNKTASYKVEVVKNPVAGIEIIKAPNKLKLIEESDGEWTNNWSNGQRYFNYYLGDIGGLQLRVNYTDGRSETVDFVDPYYGRFEINGEYFYLSDSQQDKSWGIGKHMVTINYMGRSATYEVEVVENPVKGIELIKTPTKLKLIEEYDGHWVYSGDDGVKYDKPFFFYNVYELNGLKIKINYTDGKTKIVDYQDGNGDFTIDGERVHVFDNQYKSPWGLGEQEVTLSYMGRRASYKVEVVKNPVESIEVSKLPDKQRFIKEVDGEWRNIWRDGVVIDEQYFHYTFYELKGLQFKLNYSDGTSETVDYEQSDDGFMINGERVLITTNQYESPWNIGTHTVTIKYMGKDCSYEVKVVESNDKPVIKGAEPVTLKAGETFNPMSGVTALDKEDGDLTSQVSVTGDVDTSTSKTYQLTYTVTDSDGNKAAVTREVKVILELKGQASTSIVSENNIIPSGSTMKVVVVTDKNEINEVIKALKSTLEKAANFSVLEINIFDSSNKEINQLDGTVTVKAPIPKDIDSNKPIKVYRMGEDGTLIELTYKIEGEYILFETNHFSTFIIAQEGSQVVEPIEDDKDSELPIKDKENTEIIKEDNNGDKAKSPKTGDSFNSGLLILMMTLSLGAIVSVVVKKKETN